MNTHPKNTERLVEAAPVMLATLKALREMTPPGSGSTNAVLDIVIGMAEAEDAHKEATGNSPATPALCADFTCQVPVWLSRFVSGHPEIDWGDVVTTAVKRVVDFRDAAEGAVREMCHVCNPVDSSGAQDLDGPHPMLGRRCLVRTYSAGVHIGDVVYIKPDNSGELRLKNALRLWRWTGGCLSLSAVANSGIKGGRLNRTGEVYLTGVIEIIPTTPEAEETYVHFIEGFGSGSGLGDGSGDGSGNCAGRNGRGCQGDGAGGGYGGGYGDGSGYVNCDEPPGDEML